MPETWKSSKIIWFLNIFSEAVMARLLFQAPEISKTLKNISFFKFLVEVSWLLQLSSMAWNPQNIKNTCLVYVFGGAVLALEAL